MKHPRTISMRQRRRVLARHGHGCYWRPVGFYANRPSILMVDGCVGSLEGFSLVVSSKLP